MKKIYLTMKDGRELAYSKLTSFKDPDEGDDMLHVLARALLGVNDQIEDYRIKKED